MAEDKNQGPAALEKILKSKVRGFPAEILEGIDNHIAAGNGPDKIRAYMSKAYVGALAIPNRKTIAQWIKHRKPEVMAKGSKTKDLMVRLNDTEGQLKEMRVRLDMASSDPLDAKELLKKLVTFTLIRMQLTAKIQDNLLDPRVEQNITNQVGEVRTLIGELSKMENQLGAHEAVAKIMIEKFLFELAPVVRKAVEYTYGSTKTKEFLERLSKTYKTIDMERIRVEAVTEVAAMGKEGGQSVKKVRADPA